MALALCLPEVVVEKVVGHSKAGFFIVKLLRLRCRSARRSVAVLHEHTLLLRVVPFSALRTVGTAFCPDSRSPTKETITSAVTIRNARRIDGPSG